MGAKERKEAAKERQETSKAAAKEKSTKEAEDAYWRGAGEGDKSKAQKAKDEAEAKRQEALRKKEEARKLAEQEEKELSAPKAKTAPVAVNKVTQYQLTKQKEFEERMRQEQARERELEAKREVSEDRYVALVEHENINRRDGIQDEARSVEAALAVLGVAEQAEDKHPEKRMKAAWKAFEERMLPVIKEEKKGLKMSQYRDMLWKMWQKSPDNPINAAAASSSKS